MLPFTIHLRSGSPVSEQILFAVKKAIIVRELKPGDRFPSVRVLSQELRINPNTAHKVIAMLIQERLLSPQPGVGTVVIPIESGSPRDRAALLEGEVEKLIVQAKQLKLELEDVVESVEQHWIHLSGTAETGGSRSR